MSANRTSQQITEQRRREVDRLATLCWEIFIGLGMTHRDIHGETFLDRVLAEVARRQLDWQHMAQLNRAATGRYCRADLQEWMAYASTPAQIMCRLVAHSIGRQIRELVNTEPCFDAVTEPGWVFVGRYRRNLDELPLRASHQAIPSHRYGIVDLWVHEASGRVRVRGEFIEHDCVTGDDSYAIEARRRLTSVTAS